MTRHGPAPRWTLLPHARGEAAEPRVRAWLAREFGGGAGDYRFERDAHGRPRLRHARLDCSWSHSGERLLVACGAGVRVGADLEVVRPRANALALARRFFAAEEIDWLHGRGLAFGLHRLAFAEREGALFLQRCDAELGDPGDWAVREFSPAPDALAALAWRRG